MYWLVPACLACTREHKHIARDKGASEQAISEQIDKGMFEVIYF